MAIYYVICITKKPSHDDPYTAIQSYGVSTKVVATSADETWSQLEMIAAIEGGRHTVKCIGKKPGTSDYEFAELEVVNRAGNKYVRSKNDGDKPDNLLAQSECPNT